MNAGGLVSDVARRLAHAGLAVPILLPAQAEIPPRFAEQDTQGRPKAKGERGLHIYLRDIAPEGFVQIWRPGGTYVSQVRDINSLPVTVIAPHEAAAETLAVRVMAALHGTPLRPTPYAVLNSGQREQLQGEGLSIALIFQTTTFIPLGDL